jgi:hypothetical protein
MRVAYEFGRSHRVVQLIDSDSGSTGQRQPVSSRLRPEVSVYAPVSDRSFA